MLRDEVILPVVSMAMLFHALLWNVRGQENDPETSD